MAPSTPPPPPPPPPPPDTARPLFQNPPRPPNSHPFYSSPPASRLPSNPNPNYPQLAPRHPQDPSQQQQLLYPVASSGRGFLRPIALPPAHPSSRSPSPFMFPYLDQGQPNPLFVRSNPHLLIGNASGAGGGGGGVMPGVVKGIPLPSSQHPKVGTHSASISDINNYKDLRDGNKDAALATVRDRKVRINDNASLYALCRSWLRNGFPEGTQPQYLDTTKSLPRPLPVAAQAENSPDKMEKDKEEEDEDNDSYENMSEKELLQRHIKRAKRVRSRLRDERLQRITRYKTRLALLLPPMVDQHFKNESAPAN